MRIGRREIGPGLPPYVIAEIGVNHDGRLSRALELVAVAADAGADAVKLQCFDAGLLMGRAAKLARYQAEAGERDPVEMLARLELTADELGRIADAAHDRGLHAIVTVFSVELVEAAAAIPWDAFKTASPDIVHRPLLEAIADLGKPMIVSTGAATIEEVERAAGWLEGRASSVAMLQCVSSYPTPPESAALGGMREIMGLFPGPVGYSDHTVQIDTGALAVACGAVILEKHLTYDRDARGPDHAASLSPGEFARYVELARAADPAKGIPSDPRVGDRCKRVLECERDVRAVSRQSLTAARDLEVGCVLTPADITFRRPGLGLEPFCLNDVVGRPLARPVEADMLLRPEDIA